MRTRDELLFDANLAEQAERYDEMVEATKAIVELCHQQQEELSIEERNALSVVCRKD
jgi:14-3-3 protein epsilon